jgi:steroid 5-alpha reductase family enzyme
MSLFIPLLIALGVAFTAWCIYLIVKNPGIIDVFWPLNIFIVSTTYLLLNDWSTLSTLSLVLCLLWSSRLSLYLFLTRTAKGLIEKRYEEVVGNWSHKNIGFLVHYLFQGLLAWIIALPFFFISQQSTIHLIDGFIALLILLSLGAETHADLTLNQFQTSKIGGICKKGLWQFSRHPNYFFECLIWIGFAMFGLFNLTSVLSLLSPIILFSIMWFFTIPITETKSLKKRGDLFKQYQAEVSCFIPMKSKLKEK